jgi:photosystem II stability/assembly factor-like uncharacterized protein
MTEMSDRDLKLALDALDARQVPPAVRDWDSRALAALQARPPRMHRSRLRLLVAACVALAVFAFLASGAGAWVGLPNPLDLAFHRGGPSGHKPARPQAVPSASPSHASATSPATPIEPPNPSSSPSASHKGPSPAATAVPRSWPWDPHAARFVWRRRPSGTTAELASVTFVGVDGWAVGDRGAVVSTTDGGARWVARTSGYPGYLSDVAFADAEHGWATDENPPHGAAVLASTDGGVSWRIQATSNYRLTAIAAVDASHAWAVGLDGNRGRILATSDGETWHEQKVGRCGFLHDVSFVDLEHGWAVGEGGTIVATTDGGATWTAQYSHGKATLSSVCFSDAMHGVAAGTLEATRVPGALAPTRAVVLATSDGGATWRVLNLGDKDTSMTRLAFVDQRHGWAIARYGDLQLCLVTRDGGASWHTLKELRSPEGSSQGLRGVGRVTTGEVCLVGLNGAVYLMKD